MKAQDCKSKLICNAQLCPREEDSLENCLFFCDEEICRTMHTPLFIKQQRKIKKKCRYPDTYFTYAMLNLNITIGKAIRGLNPDLKRDTQQKIWLKSHKERRILTDEEKKLIVERFKKAKYR